MYYIVYGLLYIFSLLPFFIIYPLSNCIAFILNNIIGYRKKVVLYNLGIAFPEKTLKEHKKIAGQFYINLIDTFLETIKLLSLSDKQIKKRAIMDLSACEAIAAKGKIIQFHSGHQMNWEYGHYVIAEKLTIPWIGVYMRINNKVLDKIFYKIRSHKGTILVAAQEFKERVNSLFIGQYALGLAADQNPGVPERASWMYLFTKAAPFATGPEIGARKNKAAVVFVRFVKVKRGYYRFEPTVITEDASLLKEGELTIMYRDFLEETIRQHPDNYLWTHRRWKWEWNDQYSERWIDNSPKP